jgi:hypothetical protein
MLRKFRPITLITPLQAATLLGVDRAELFRRSGVAAHLAKVRQGKRFSFVLEEVEALRKELLMDYVILLARDPSSLASQVNDLIKRGWQPQGGVAASEVHEEGTAAATQWAQAMVKPQSE